MRVVESPSSNTSLRLKHNPTSPPAPRPHSKPVRAATADIHVLFTAPSSEVRNSSHNDPARDQTIISNSSETNYCSLF